MEIFRVDHPAGRAAVARRGVPRRRRRGPPARPPAAIGELIRARVARRAADHLLGRGGHDQVRRQARLDPGQAGRPARRPARQTSSSSCTRCRSARCGGSGRRPRSSCPGSGCAPSATSPTPRSRTLERALGPAAGTPPAALAWGRDPRVGRPARAGQEHRRRGDLRHRRRRPGGRSAASCCGLSEQVAARLRAPGYVGRTVVDQGPLRRLHARSPGPARCATPPTSARRSTPTAPGLYEALGLRPGPDPARRRPGRGSRRRRRRRTEQLRPRRPGARLAGGRAGRRPGRPAVRPGRGAAGGPGPAGLRRRRSPGRCRTVDRDDSFSRVSPEPMPAYAGAGRHRSPGP